jgi:hypothetical protein
VAHHNFEMEESLKQKMNELLGGEQLGATGKFPEGVYGKNDEGEIKFAVAADPAKGKVLVDFGKPVRLFGMTTDQAVELAELLQKNAWEARGIK